MYCLGLFEITEWKPCMWLLNTDTMAGNAAKQWLLIAASHVLRPSNSSRRVSRIPHALIGATHLIAARHVVLALKARCHAVEVLLACSIPLFLIEFVTAWSWYGHFSKSLFSLNLWLVVYQLSVLHRHLSVNVPPQGNATGFWDWSQVFGDRNFWVPGLYRTLSQ